MVSPRFLRSASNGYGITEAKMRRKEDRFESAGLVETGDRRSGGKEPPSAEEFGRGSRFALRFDSKNPTLNEKAWLKVSPRLMWHRVRERARHLRSEEGRKEGDERWRSRAQKKRGFGTTREGAEEISVLRAFFCEH